MVLTVLPEYVIVMIVIALTESDVYIIASHLLADAMTLLNGIRNKLIDTEMI